MARTVKVILFLLLTITFGGIVSSVSADKADGAVSARVCPLSEQGEVGMPQLPYLPVAKLNNNMQSHQIATTRVLRVLTGEYLFSLKNMLLECAGRDTSLLQHLGRIYSSTPPCYCRASSEYYVFALRHIII